VTVNQGQELKPAQLKEQPTLSWTVDEKALHAVVLCDPDAPNRAEAKFRNWCDSHGTGPLNVLAQATLPGGQRARQ